MHCKICDSKCFDQSITKKGKIYHHCDTCGFSFLDDKFHLNAEKEKQRYDLHENNLENLAYVKSFEEFIEEYISPYPVKSILDFGSGPNPVLVELLKQKAYQVDFYDPFYQKQKPKKQFDLVCSTEVVEHFCNPLKDISLMQSYMKAGAYLAIMTGFNPGKDKFSNWNYKNDETHVSFYSMKTFEKIASIFNLQIIKHSQNKFILLKNLAKNFAIQ